MERQRNPGFVDNALSRSATGKLSEGHKTLFIMSEEQRLQQKIVGCEQRWNKLSGLITELTNQYDRENCAEERYRLQGVITDKKTERQIVAAECQKLEAELTSIKQARLLQDIW